MEKETPAKLTEKQASLYLDQLESKFVNIVLKISELKTLKDNSMIKVTNKQQMIKNLEENSQIHSEIVFEQVLTCLTNKAEKLKN